MHEYILPPLRGRIISYLIENIQRFCPGFSFSVDVPAHDM
jgi:hypothetical protein